MFGSEECRTIKAIEPLSRSLTRQAGKIIEFESLEGVLLVNSEVLPFYSLIVLLRIFSEGWASKRESFLVHWEQNIVLKKILNQLRFIDWNASSLLLLKKSRNRFEVNDLKIQENIYVDIWDLFESRDVFKNI